MDRPLSPETNDQIRALCELIAQRDQLGKDVQEELRGHIEDKVIGYLHGEEAISEADAFVLAREHFGDPSVVKALLLDMYGDSWRHPWLRTTIELAVVALAVGVLVRMGRFGAVMFAAYAYDIYELKPMLRWIDNARDAVGPIALLCVLLAMLRAWTRAGKVFILESLTRWRLIVLFVAAIAVWIVVPEVVGQGVLVNNANGMREAAIQSLVRLATLAACTAWIALAARQTKSLHVLTCIALSYTIFTCVVDLRGVFPAAFVTMHYDPSREGWVNFPRGTIVCYYKFTFGVFAQLLKEGRFGDAIEGSLFLLWGFAGALVKAAVGLLCYLGLRQLRVPGFGRAESHHGPARVVS